MFAGDREASFIWGFNPQKNAVETGLGHHLHHFVIRSQVDGGFSGETKGITPLNLPLFQGR